MRYGRHVALALVLLGAIIVFLGLAVASIPAALITLIGAAVITLGLTRIEVTP